ncbi:LysR family transcriptional regulator [Eggerthella sinensis]|uniref:LysR substrate-binding domain-containing protein n=1 Tax=Eggerthella sinensis TaxID=242230 RepID=UPI00266C1D13|nr:LysR family transcriptional regulator [Eggerthella sinensis]
MDIRQLDYFIAVAQRGNFTKAADELFLSRQALSKAVRNLEHELGHPLLINRDNHLELTDEGRALREDALPVVDAFKQLEQRYLGTLDAPPLRQTLSVAMAHGTALSMPPRAIDAFRAEHPDIVLSVEEVTTETAIDMVRAGESDISLVGSAPQYLAEFDLMLVVETGVFLYVPVENPLAAQAALALSDLEGQPFMTFGKRNHLHRYFMEACDAAGVHPNIVMTTSDSELLVRSAVQQQALFFGFPPNVLNDPKEGRVLMRLDLQRESAFGTYAIRRKATAPSTSARAFWEYLGRV